MAQTDNSLLREIARNTSNGVDGGVTTGGATESTLLEVRDRLPVGTRKIPHFISTSTSGVIAAGYQSVAVANIGSAAGVLDGSVFPANASTSWSVINSLDDFAALSYDATGTTFLITEVR